MHTPSGLEKRIDQAMAGIDDIRRAPAPPFLYTRVQAAIRAHERSTGSRLLQWLLQPAVSYALALLILLLNLWVVMGAASPEVPVNSSYAGDYGLNGSPDELIYTLNSEELP